MRLSAERLHARDEREQRAPSVDRPTPLRHHDQHHQRDGHSHAHAHLTGGKLRLGFFLALAVLLVELAGGVFSHSLALLSDAGHVVTDVAALGLAWFAARQAERPANERRTFGYHRVGILTALANSVTLLVIAVVVAYEAYQRFRQPAQVEPGIMLVAAGVAIAVNLFIALGLREAGHENLNARAAALHAAGDLAISLGVVVAALLIALTGATWVDPLVSLFAVALIVVGAVNVIRETVDVLLESTPRRLSVPSLVRDMLRIRGVRDVHDLHIWTIANGMLALSCHTVIDDVPPSASAPILDDLTGMLREQYGVTHTTIQFESEAHDRSHEGHCACQPQTCDTLYCELQPPCEG